jgi:hypothetical protein
MPGKESGGVTNFWYSFDYGMAHFISLDGETDLAYSPSYTLTREKHAAGETLPARNATYLTDAGPFGSNGNETDNKSYQQYQWLVKDLAKIDRKKT